MTDSADIPNGLGAQAPAPFEALPRRQFGCILADVPSQFTTFTPVITGRSIESKYPTMTTEELCALPVRDLAAPTGCHLFFWTTGPRLPDALRVIAAWGFKYSGSGFVWIKLKMGRVGGPFTTNDLHMGSGYTTRKNAEFCLLARRGGAKRIARDVHEVIVAPRREHSRKPDEQYERIERYCCGPRLELFSRNRRDGWTSWGNQVGMFDG